MKLCRVSFTLVCGAAVSSRSTGDAVSADEQVANARWMVDCTLGILDCWPEVAAISERQAHSNATCAAAASAAEARDSATEYGFRPALYDVASQYDADAIMVVNWLMPSGYLPIGDNTH